MLGLLTYYLVHRHMDYAVESAFVGIPRPETKTVLKLYFLKVLGQANAIVHLFDKQFTDSLPLVVTSSCYVDRQRCQKAELEWLGANLDRGWGRMLAAHHPGAEVAKADFNPLRPAQPLLTTASVTC